MSFLLFLFLCPVIFRAALPGTKPLRSAALFPVQFLAADDAPVVLFIPDGQVQLYEFARTGKTMSLAVQLHLIPIESQLLCDPLITPALQPKGADQLFLFLFHTRSSLRPGFQSRLCFPVIPLKNQPFPSCFPLISGCFGCGFVTKFGQASVRCRNPQNRSSSKENRRFLNPMAWYIFQFHRPGRGRPLTISRILTREGAAVSVGLHHREVTHPPGASPDREKSLLSRSQITVQAA